MEACHWQFQRVGIEGSKESVNAANYAIAIAKRHNAELIAVIVLTSDIGFAYSSPGSGKYNIGLC